MKIKHQDHGEDGTGIIRIVVIENDDIVSSAVCTELHKDSHIKAVGVNPEREDPVECVKREKPHVILLDLMWNKQLRGGWRLLTMFSRECPQTAVIILSARTELADVNEAWRKGVSGYVPKSQWQKELREAVLTVSRGASWFSPWLGKRVWRPSEETRRLRPREREAYYLFVRDLSSQAVADELNIVVDTVHVHRAHIRERIGHQDGWTGIARDAQRDPDLLCELTNMERCVFDLYVQGVKTRAGIAERLGIPEVEVENFIRSIRCKLNCPPEGWNGIAREEGDID